MAAQFKVLIAGGSLVGLTLALALERAGIDYEVFEKGELGPDLGASIAIHGPAARILDQLGVWKDIEPTVTAVERAYRVHGKDGRPFLDSYYLRELMKVLRWPVVFTERHRLLRLLYSHIGDKSKVHDHTAIVSYEEESDSHIVVTTSDGRSFRGDILIGADGIHSRVRALMSERISITDQALSKEINHDLSSGYDVLFGISPQDPTASLLPDGRTVINVYADDHSAIVTRARPDTVFWFFIIKKNLYQGGDGPRYTQEHAQAVIDRYGGLVIVPNYTIKDLWEMRIRATLVPMEDGIVKQWSHGRVLLLGDSVHKTTINAGLGGNLAIEAVAQFTNGLVSLLNSNPHPSQQKLTTLFETMDGVHRPRASFVRKASNYACHSESQQSLFLKFYERYIVPRLSDQAIAARFVDWAKGAPWLEFLPLPERDANLPARREEEKQKREKERQRTQTVTSWSVFGGGAVLAAVAIWLRHRR